MIYNIDVLESIAQGKTELKSSNQWCEEIYGFNAFGFYNKKQPNSRKYFIKQMEDFLHQNDSTSNVTNIIVDYIMSDKNSKVNLKFLLHWLFNTDSGQKFDILNPDFYKNMDDDGYSPIDKDDVVGFLSNPDQNNYLYKVYFRHYMIEYFSMMPDKKYHDSDIYNCPIGSSIYESLTEYYYNTWNKIAEKVPNLIKGDSSNLELFINQEIIFTTGRVKTDFSKKDDVYYLFGMEDNNEEFKRLNQMNCSNIFTWVDTDLNYASIVGINFLEFRKFLSKKFAPPTQKSNGFNSFKLEFSFRAIFDDPIKTIDFGYKDSKSECDTIFLTIIPERLKEPPLRHKSIKVCDITLLVELASWWEKSKPDLNIRKTVQAMGADIGVLDKGKTEKFISLSGDNRNKLIVGKIPLKLILLRN